MKQIVYELCLSLGINTDDTKTLIDHPDLPTPYLLRPKFGAHVIYGRPRSGKTTFVKSIVGDNILYLDEPESVRFGGTGIVAVIQDIIIFAKKNQGKTIAVDSLRLIIYQKNEGGYGKQGISNAFRRIVTLFNCFASMLGINILLVFTGEPTYVEDLRASCIMLVLVDNFIFFAQARDDKTLTPDPYKSNSGLKEFKFPRVRIQDFDLIHDICEGDNPYALSFVRGSDPLWLYPARKKGSLFNMEKGLPFEQFGNDDPIKDPDGFGTSNYGGKTVRETANDADARVTKYMEDEQ